MQQAVPSPQRGVEFLASRHFIHWLVEANASLAFTTYHAGKLFMVGRQSPEQLSVFERTFNRCMGLWASDESLVMSSLFQIWRFENALDAGENHNGYDRLYVPLLAHTTGDIDVHDIGVDRGGRIVFVSTLFGCLATVSDSASFHPLWWPPFLTKLAAEDRCHLNGLAFRLGEPAFVTCVSQTDVADGWRDRRRDGGVVIDLATNAVVLEGLSMPHSPRWHRDRLWLLDSGNGQFGYADLARGRFEPVAFCPGYARGLALHGDYAIIGLSRPRENRTFAGLALDDALRRRDAQARCGLQVVDLRTGDAVHWLRIDGVVEELYDVTVLPGVARPMALGLISDEIHRMVRLGAPRPLRESA
ncbi:MAG: TIGR03032 family protein [Burkholderiales bacterium]|nr:TIGR03032 family protein [Burkholderiales bacterium]